MKNQITICITGIFLISTFLFNSCQKEELVLSGIENQENGQFNRLKSGINVTYLENLISKIETLVSEGMLSEGTGNSLLAKVENAIRSIQNGNTNAVKGQLNALINQVEGLIDRGVLTPEQGQPLIDGAENELILADGYFIDPRDGEKYTVVQIGTQLWMAENLRATIYSDGTPVNYLCNLFSVDSNGAYAWYNDDETMFKDTHGALYNWYAVNPELNGGKNICPDGWHVPINTEFTELITFLGGINDAGCALKSVTGWDDPNTCATNISGFSAMPGGRSFYPKSYNQMNLFGYWWSSTESLDNPEFAWYISLGYNMEGVYQHNFHKGWLYSVRCIRD